MKNIKEFKKLFKINIPVEEHFDYYIDVLSESKEYEDIKDLVSEYEKYEIHCEDAGFKSSKSYKLDHALPLLVNHIKQTNAYKSLMEEDFSNAGFRTKDTLKDNDNTYLMSIDFSSANYSALKTYDKDNELFESWDELCEKKHIHPVLAKSKSFRQFVFGNVAPKRLQNYQHRCINIIVNALIESDSFIEDDFVFISYDEFIIRLRPDHVLAINRIHILNSEVGKIISEEGINMPTHYNVFKLETLGKGKYIKTHYNVKMGGLSEKFTSLVGVPRNEFFKYFKTSILKKELDERDLYFEVDGKLAKWVI